MKTITIWKKGKKFEVRIVDNFSGDYIIIDNDFISKKSLTENGYLEIPKVKEIIDSKIPLYNFSQQ